MSDAVEDYDHAPGWGAINQALEAVHGPGEPPHHYGTIIKYMTGGPDPIDGFSVYRPDTPRPHWHYVSYGMSELYEKVSDDPELSGWGFEFTFRCERTAGEEEPPAWPMNLMQNLARYVFDSGNVFGAGHKLDANSPIALDSATQLTAIAFVEDPQLAPIETPHGALEFLQLVGLAADEHEACTRWDTLSFAALLEERYPFWITELGRDSILRDSEMESRVEDGIVHDGSSQAFAFVESLAWDADGDALTITVGANAVGTLRQMLRGRTLHARPFGIQGPEQVVVFQPADGAPSWNPDEEGDPVLNVTLSVAEQMASDIEPRRAATYRWPDLPGVTLVSRPGQIRDQDGNVVEIVE